MTEQKITRRHVIGGAAVAGIGVPLLAACGSSDTAADTSAGTGSGGPVTLGPTSEVPVGGGKIYPKANVVVTQPSAGEFKAFSAICTHQGCPVTSVADGTIDCTCHGSKFSIEDGSVVNGPATIPLEENTSVKVDGTNIVAG